MPRWDGGAARGVPLVKRRGTPDRGCGSQWYPRPSVLPAGGRNGEVAAGARESSQRRGAHETAPLHVLRAALWRRVVPFGVGGSIPSPLAPIQTGGGIGVFRGNRPDQCAEIGILNSSTQAVPVFPPVFPSRRNVAGRRRRRLPDRRRPH